MLVLSGLPTIFPKLVAARTYAERMFRVVTVTRLSDADSREAIVQPTRRAQCPVKFTDTAVEIICRESARYPYFIQFICRELYDSFIQQRRDGEQASLPIEPIQHKLDEVFYAGRWAKVPDRQRDLLWVIANLRHPHDEFTISELVPKSSTLLERGFSASQANQMLARLTEQGLIYKNRLGKYAFAIPLLGKFILRTYGQPSDDAEAE